MKDSYKGILSFLGIVFLFILSILMILISFTSYGWKALYIIPVWGIFAFTIGFIILIGLCLFGVMFNHFKEKLYKHVHEHDVHKFIRQVGYCQEDGSMVTFTVMQGGKP